MNRDRNVDNLDSQSSCKSCHDPVVTCMQIHKCVCVLDIVRGGYVVVFDNTNIMIKNMY